MEHIINSFSSLEEYLTALPNQDTKGDNVLYHFSLYYKYKV